MITHHPITAHFLWLPLRLRPADEDFFEDFLLLLLLFVLWLFLELFLVALDFLPDLSLLRLPALLDFFELWLDFLLLTAPLFLLLALLLLAVLTEDLPPRLDFFGLVQHSRYRAKRVHKRTTRAQMPAKMTVVGGPEVVPRICLMKKWC